MHFSSLFLAHIVRYANFAEQIRSNMKFKAFLQSHGSRLSHALFFLLAWWWASWWMGDFFRIAYENSFFTTDSTIMHSLWQKPYGSLWILGRAALTLYHWPLLGGFVIALLLSVGSWLVGYCLRLRPRWRWLQWLPAGAWMAWNAWLGFNVYFQFEPGRTFGVLVLVVAICAIDAFIIWTFKSKHHHAVQPAPVLSHILAVLVIIAAVAIPSLMTQLRHPYVRPVTRMQVQMLHEDWQGMVQTAHDNATLSYRPLAAFYAIALVHTGRLAEDLFDIRLDFDTLYVVGRNKQPNIGTDLYLIDCDYTAGLFRSAEHKAVEHLTMDGPTLFSLKHLTRLALLDHNWALARKYLDIISAAPFESAFIERYTPMVGSEEAVESDPNFALLRKGEPVIDGLESFFEPPTFLGYHAVNTKGRSQEALIYSVMTNLYSKRMPAFLERCSPFVGTTPPRLIAEGLVTQSVKNPAIMEAFPQLQMAQQAYKGFLQNVSYAVKDRPTYARQLFDQYKGYYPYYYFFGNLKSTRKRDNKETSTSSAGVN